MRRTPAPALLCAVALWAAFVAVAVPLSGGFVSPKLYGPPPVDIDWMQRIANAPEEAQAQPQQVGGVWHPPMRWRVARADLVLRSEPAVPVLLTKALAHLGTNPTGWQRLWCARFIAMIAPKVAAKVDNPNLARAYAELPNVKHPRPGDIVVLSRGRDPNAGHIGVVKAVKRNSLIVVSGNTFWNGKRRTVGINEYPMSRVVAFVDPRMT